MTQYSKAKYDNEMEAGAYSTPGMIMLGAR